MSHLPSRQMKVLIFFNWNDPQRERNELISDFSPSIFRAAENGPDETEGRSSGEGEYVC